MKKLLVLSLAIMLLLPGCAYHAVTVARLCGDNIEAVVDGTPISVKGDNLNAIIIRQMFFTLEPGRQVPPLCDVKSIEKGENATKDNVFRLSNPDIVTEQSE